MILTKFSRRIKSISLAISSAASVLAILIGAFIQLAWLEPTWFPAFMDGDFGLALPVVGLGLLFLGLGLALGILGQRFFSSFFGVLAFLIGVGAGVEYVFEVDLGFSQFLLIGSEDSYLLAPGTSISFVLLGLGLFGMMAKRRFAIIVPFSGASFTIGLVALLGYLVRIEAAYGWSDYAKMALLTAVGIMLIAAGLTAQSLRNYDFERTLRTLQIPVWVFVGACAISIAVWENIHREQRQSMLLASAETAKIFASAIDEKVKRGTSEVERIARHWSVGRAGELNEDIARWEAREHLRYDSGLKAIEWIDQKYRVRWVEPIKGNEEAVGLDAGFEENRRAALDAAKGERRTVLSRPIDLVQGGKGFLILAPVFFRDQSFGGFVAGVYSFEELLSPVFSEFFKSGYGIDIYERSSLLFGNLPEKESKGWGFTEQVSEVAGSRWIFKVGIRPERFAARGSAIANLSLGAGLIFSILLGLLTHMAQKATVRKIETEGIVLQRTKELLESNEELHRISNQLMIAQEGERRRIARELHDEFGQSLAALVFKIGQVCREMEDMGIKHHLREVSKDVNGMITEVRRISRDLHPAILDDLGLEAALDWLIQRFSKRTGIEVDLMVSFKDKLESRYEIAFFRFIQEGLTNVAKHSEASHAEVFLEKEGDEYWLSVRDNGVGIPDGSIRGVGLAGMEERARAFGGSVYYGKNPAGKGALIRVFLPTGIRPGLASRIHSESSEVSSDNA